MKNTNRSCVTASVTGAATSPLWYDKDNPMQCVAPSSLLCQFCAVPELHWRYFSDIIGPAWVEMECQHLTHLWWAKWTRLVGSSRVEKEHLQSGKSGKTLAGSTLPFASCQLGRTAGVKICIFIFYFFYFFGGGMQKNGLGGKLYKIGSGALNIIYIENIWNGPCTMNKSGTFKVTILTF